MQRAKRDTKPDIIKIKSKTSNIMVKVTPYISPCRKGEDPSTKKLHLRVSKPATDTTAVLAEKITHDTALTKTEIVSVLVTLRHYIVEALGEGRSIHLDELGRFSLIPHFTKDVRAGDKFRNEDISTKGIQFLPDADLLKEVRFKTHYQADPMHQAKETTLDEAMLFCESWLAEHEVIIARDLERGMMINKTKAHRLLAELAKQGRLVVQKYGVIKQYRLKEG